MIGRWWRRMRAEIKARGADDIAGMAAVKGCTRLGAGDRRGAAAMFGIAEYYSLKASILRAKGDDPETVANAMVSWAEDREQRKAETGDER